MKRVVLMIGFLWLFMLFPSGKPKPVCPPCIYDNGYYDITGKKMSDTINMPNGVYIKKYLTTRKVIVNRK